MKRGIGDKCLSAAIVVILVGGSQSGALAAPSTYATWREIRLATDLVIGGGEDEAALHIGPITDVAVDSHGRIYAADLQQQCIHKLSGDGTYLAKLGRAGEGPGDIMFAAVLAIDNRDRLHIAGQGGRVDILDTNGVYVGGFRREHSSAVARSIAVGPDGSVVIVAVNILDQTTIDVYDGNHVHRQSFCDTYAARSGESWRAEALYAGGFCVVTPDSLLHYLQLVPYELRTYTIGGGAAATSDRRGRRVRASATSTG